MRFFSYFYQLKASFTKFWYLNKVKAPKQETTKNAQELNASLKADLELKCKRAALEIRNIEHFTHWPITEAKVKQSTSLVYLDVTRKNRKQPPHTVQAEHKVIKVIDKTCLTNNVVVIKKLP